MTSLRELRFNGLNDQERPAVQTGGRPHGHNWLVSLLTAEWFCWFRHQWRYLINQGKIRADTSGKTIRFTDTTTRMHGRGVGRQKRRTLSVAGRPGPTAGTLNITGGTLNLGGTFSGPNLGTWNPHQRFRQPHRHRHRRADINDGMGTSTSSRHAQRRRVQRCAGKFRPTHRTATQSSLMCYALQPHRPAPRLVSKRPAT